MAASDTPSAEQNDEPVSHADADSDGDSADGSAADDGSSSGMGCLGMIGFFVLISLLGSLFDDGSDDSTSETASTTCQEVQGVYVGTYSGVSPSGYENGDVGFVVQESCDFIVSMNGQRMGDGTLEREYALRYLFPSGVAVEFSTAPAETRAQSASWTETGNGYRATYTLRRVE